MIMFIKTALKNLVENVCQSIKFKIVFGLFIYCLIFFNKNATV